MKNEVRITITRKQLDEALCEWVEKHMGLTVAPDPNIRFEEDFDELTEDDLAASIDVVMPPEGGKR